MGRGRGRKRGRGREMVLRNKRHLYLTPVHSITIFHALKLAWRTVQVSLGVSSPHNIPLEASSRTQNQLHLTRHILIDYFGGG